MANINPTPPRLKPNFSNTGHDGPPAYIQSPQKDDIIWKKIVDYLSRNERTVEEEYLLIEQKKSKLPSIQRHYIEIFVNYNLQLERFNNQYKWQK